MGPMIANGQPAPDFVLPDLEGQLHRLVDWRGRVVVLNFWSAECPWAEHADRELLQYLQEWGEAVVWVSVASNANEPVALLRQTAEARRLPLVLHDARQQVAGLYGAQTTPHCFVVDAHRILRYQGAVNDRTFRLRIPGKFYLHAAVQAVLSGKTPDPDLALPYGCTVVLF